MHRSRYIRLEGCKAAFLFRNPVHPCVDGCNPLGKHRRRRSLLCRCTARQLRRPFTISFPRRRSERVEATDKTFFYHSVSRDQQAARGLYSALRGFSTSARVGGRLVLFPEGKEAAIAEFPEGVQKEDA